VWNVAPSEERRRGKSVGSGLTSSESQTDDLDDVTEVITYNPGSPLLPHSSTRTEGARLPHFPPPSFPSPPSATTRVKAGRQEKISLFNKAIRALRQPFVRGRGAGRMMRDARCTSLFYAETEEGVVGGETGCWRERGEVVGACEEVMVTSKEEEVCSEETASISQRTGSDYII